MATDVRHLSDVLRLPGTQWRMKMLFKVYRAGVKRDLWQAHPAGSVFISDWSVKGVIVARCSQLAMCEFIPKGIMEFLPPANEFCEGYVFTGVCLSTGGCVVGGMRGSWGGGMCSSPRGMCGSWGVCMAVRGHAWQLGGMHGSQEGHAGQPGGGACWAARGHVWQPGGACMAAGGHAWLPWVVRGIWWDTVNEQAVHILLECILVLKCFTEFTEFSDKNICHYNKRTRTCHTTASCERDQDDSIAPTRHTCRDRIFKLNPIHASVIFRFPEFAEFSESSALFRKNSNTSNGKEASSLVTWLSLM